MSYKIRYSSWGVFVCLLNDLFIFLLGFFFFSCVVNNTGGGIPRVSITITCKAAGKKEMKVESK